MAEIAEDKGDPDANERLVISTARLDLLLFTMESLDALLAGRASSIDGVALPADWVRRSEGLLRRRLDQVSHDRSCEPWLLRAMVRRDTRTFVGRIGFHGEPGINALGTPGAVELGYTVEPEFRRCGFAEEAIRGMIAWAQARSVSRFMASIGPTNIPSLELAAKLGFTQVAEVIDEEDGPEIVFEFHAQYAARP